MRSGLYRRLDVLRSAARARPSNATVRSWSNTSTSDPAADQRFPLYRPQPEPDQYPTLRSFPGAQHQAKSLPSDKRIRKTAKAQLTDRAIEGLPELQEDDLRDFYAAVMESGKDETPAMEGSRIEAPSLSGAERQRVLDGLSQRLLPSPERAGPSNLINTTHEQEALRNTVTKIVDELRSLVPEPTPEMGPGGGRVSLGLISRTEWDVLLDETARYSPANEAEGVLQLMTSHGSAPTAGQVTRVMEAYSRVGRVTDVARLHDSMKQAGLEMTDRTSDLLIEAHLRHSPPLIYPAVDLLSSLAAAGTPLPQSSYNVLLTYLTASATSSSQTRALAWDLWANMRLTAHPTPDRQVYSTMIRACADARDPQPERARDLWIELTSSPSPSPSAGPERGEYSAIIRALSSTKQTYLEAFDLLRQMLAKHSEATFVPFDESPQAVERWSRYIPTLDTFIALLEGTKRAGDLPRARWVLNEVVRLQASGLVAVDEELLSGVFMTYASWVPVVRRTAVKAKAKESAVEEESSGATMSSTAGEQACEETEGDAIVGRGDEPSRQVETTRSDSAHPDPLTSADALREADALFEQVIADTAPPSPTDSGSTDPGPFAQVGLTTRLVNSYLSVHLAHAGTISAAREAWNKIWVTCASANPDVLPNGWSHLQVLERCAAGDLREDRQAATAWAQDTWTQYATFADTQAGLDFSSLSPLTLPQEDKREMYRLGLSARQLERSFRAHIRLLALDPQTPADRSLSIMVQFHALFPPVNVLSTYTPTPATPFKIRLTDPTAMPESNIPPVLLWPDVDVLHQRLVREGRKKDINWLTWVCKSYEVALRKRRRWRLKKRGEAGQRRAAGRRIEDEEEASVSEEAEVDGAK